MLSTKTNDICYLSHYNNDSLSKKQTELQHAKLTIDNRQIEKLNAEFFQIFEKILVAYLPLNINRKQI